MAFAVLQVALLLISLSLSHSCAVRAQPGDGVHPTVRGEAVLVRCIKGWRFALHTSRHRSSRLEQGTVRVADPTFKLYLASLLRGLDLFLLDFASTLAACQVPSRRGVPINLTCLPPPLPGDVTCHCVLPPHAFPFPHPHQKTNKKFRTEPLPAQREALLRGFSRLLSDRHSTCIHEQVALDAWNAPRHFPQTLVAGNRAARICGWPRCSASRPCTTPACNCCSVTPRSALSLPRCCRCFSRGNHTECRAALASWAVDVFSGQVHRAADRVCGAFDAGGLLLVWPSTSAHCSWTASPRRTRWPSSPTACWTC